MMTLKTILIVMIFAGCGEPILSDENNSTNNSSNNQTAESGPKCECPEDRKSKCEGNIFITNFCDRDDNCRVSEVRTDCDIGELLCHVVEGEGCINVCGWLDCASPPLPVCEGDIVVKYDGLTTCNSNTGSCDNPEATRIDCTATDQICDQGKCVDSCLPGDPCLAPLAFCTDSMLTSFLAPGVCDPETRQCDYSAVEETTDCELNNDVCMTDKCVDLCVNITCPSPPAGSCTGNVAGYYEEGICDYRDGECKFMHRRIDCARSAKTCKNGACIQ